MNKSGVSLSEEASVTLAEQCPWCGNDVTHKEFERIKRRIRRQEKAKLDQYRQDLEKKFDAQSRLAIGEVQQQAARTLAKAKAEAVKEATTKLQEATGALEQERKAKIAAVEKLKQAEAEQVSAKKEAARHVEERVAQAREEAESEGRKELLNQREILKKASDRELLKKEAETRREREKYAAKLKQMERQLQAKTSNELGEGAELDLFEALRDAFPDDKITRTRKGQQGADIRHEVLRGGDVCAVIVYDSKNHKAWRSGFVTKLRED